MGKQASYHGVNDLAIIELYDEDLETTPFSMLTRWCVVEFGYAEVRRWEHGANAGNTKCR